MFPVNHTLFSSHSFVRSLFFCSVTRALSLRMAAPAPNSTAAQQPGPINDEDVNHWKARINDVLARPSEHVNHKSPESSRPWSNAFFGCFSPIDLCLVSWCVPCVTFGKTHHRLHKSARLEGYEPVNTSVKTSLFCVVVCQVLMSGSC